MFGPVIALGVVAAALIFAASGKSKEGGTGLPYYPRAGQVWSILFKTTRPLSQDDWQAYFANYVGDVMGVNNGPSENTYMVTARFDRDEMLPPPGTTMPMQDGGTITLVSAVQAPVAAPTAEIGRAPASWLNPPSSMVHVQSYNRRFPRR